MALKGDFGKLARLIQRTSGISSGEFVRHTLRQLVTPIRNQIQAQFEGRKDPYGSAWRKRTRNYSWPILEKTKAMRRGFSVRATSNGITVSNRQSYFVYHQSDAPRRIIPKRQVLPGKKGLGPFWTEIVSIVAKEEMRKWVSR